MSKGEVLYHSIIVLAMIFFGLVFETDIPLYAAIGILIMRIYDVLSNDE